MFSRERGAIGADEQHAFMLFFKRYETARHTFTEITFALRMNG